MTHSSLESDRVIRAQSVHEMHEGDPIALEFLFGVKTQSQSIKRRIEKSIHKSHIPKPCIKGEETAVSLFCQMR